MQKRCIIYLLIKKEDIIGKSFAVFEFNLLKAEELNTILEKIKVEWKMEG